MPHQRYIRIPRSPSHGWHVGCHRRRRRPQRSRRCGVPRQSGTACPRRRTPPDRWRRLHHGRGLPRRQVPAARLFRGPLATRDHPGPRARAIRIRGPSVRPAVLLAVPERRLPPPVERCGTEREGTRAVLPQGRSGVSEVRGLLDRGHGAHRGDRPRTATAIAGSARLVQGSRGRELARRILLQSAADLLDEFFESDEVKAMLATATTIGLPAGPRTPGTALMLGHMLLHEINGVKQTFGYAKGGMGGIAQAL